MMNLDGTGLVKIFDEDEEEDQGYFRGLGINGLGTRVLSFSPDGKFVAMYIYGLSAFVIHDTSVREHHFIPAPIHIHGWSPGGEYFYCEEGVYKVGAWENLINFAGFSIGGMPTDDSVLVYKNSYGDFHYSVLNLNGELASELTELRFYCGLLVPSIGSCFGQYAIIDSEGYIVGSKLIQGFLDEQKSRTLQEIDGGVEYDVSADGKLLAYSSCPTDAEGFYSFQNCQVSILDLETGEEYSIPEKEGMAFAPTFSPDGRHILYWFSPGGGSSWFRMYSLDTGEITDIYLPREITEAGRSTWGP